MKTRLKKLLDQFDRCNVECDGFSHIADYLLTREKIKHRVCFGSVVAAGIEIPLHYWIEVGDLTVDYRLRMWTNQNAPHGVFVAEDEDVQYDKRGVWSFKTTKILFDILTL